MGEEENKRYLLNTLKLTVQIEGIQKEIQILKQFYFNTIADYRFDTICNKYQWQILETEYLDEKLTLCEIMYLEIVDYLTEESKTLIDIQYPECLGIEDETQFAPVLVIPIDENLPFD
ncbi:hypothetical protein SAMN02745136_00508 [Anaerocolumna jejuensis DSM 15929]|uniref:Uncharacterized protein n=1 Tax=Anaerocolumna jejuensis DSM 15929 TaxID=1121322 RepID=A0A1M6KML0_9FIRM|nr:hypothetical protein [Anaerocolumna jejuensis]SHJ60171.1 hypothetical protein SAMN02745136_00508 [Anaerocolumna jejuensis DSM 15929]